jgi:hypothetical protein
MRTVLALTALALAVPAATGAVVAAAPRVAVQVCVAGQCGAQ